MQNLCRLGDCDAYRGMLDLTVTLALPLPKEIDSFSFPKIWNEWKKQGCLRSTNVYSNIKRCRISWNGAKSRRVPKPGTWDVVYGSPVSAMVFFYTLGNNNNTYPILCPHSLLRFPKFVRSRSRKWTALECRRHRPIIAKQSTIRKHASQSVYRAVHIHFEWTAYSMPYDWTTRSHLPVLPTFATRTISPHLDFFNENYLQVQFARDSRIPYSWRISQLISNISELTGKSTLSVMKMGGIRYLSAAENFRKEL